MKYVTIADLKPDAPGGFSDSIGSNPTEAEQVHDSNVEKWEKPSGFTQYFVKKYGGMDELIELMNDDSIRTSTEVIKRYMQARNVDKMSMSDIVGIHAIIGNCSDFPAPLLFKSPGHALRALVEDF